MKVYADNAATTKIGPAALAAMNACMQDHWGNPSSLHWAGRRAADALAEARETVARCLNASPREITFTSGGSEADNQALRTASPPPLSTTPCCTPWSSWSGRASLSPCCPWAARGG